MRLEERRGRRTKELSRALLSPLFARAVCLSGHLVPCDRRRRGRLSSLPFSNQPGVGMGNLPGVQHWGFSRATSALASEGAFVPNFPWHPSIPSRTILGLGARQRLGMPGRIVTAIRRPQVLPACAGKPTTVVISGSILGQQLSSSAAQSLPYGVARPGDGQGGPRQSSDGIFPRGPA